MLRRVLHKLHLVDTPLIERFEKVAGDKGISKASLELLRDLDVEVAGQMPTLRGPILFISDHIGGLDSHALMSVIERDDFKIVALSTYHVFGPAYSKKLFPIYRKKYWNHAFFEYPLNVRLDTQVQDISEEEIRSRNRQTISSAAQWVSKGGAVSIFPTGSVGKNVSGSWKAGVGHLVSQITNPKVKIVFTRIDGSHKSDLLRYVRSDVRKIFFRPKTLTVTFSEPIILPRNMEPKDVTMQLESLYRKSFSVL